MTGWRALPTTLLFAAIGPAIMVALAISVFSPAIDNLGPFETSAFWNLVAFAYVIGAPPLAATGFLTAVASRSGAHLPALTIRGALWGALFAALSAAFWMFLGPTTTDPSWQLVVAIGIAGAVAGFGSALIVGVASLFRRRGATR